MPDLIAGAERGCRTTPEPIEIVLARRLIVMDLNFVNADTRDFDPRTYQKAALCYYYNTDDLEIAVQRLRIGDYHEGSDGLLIYIPSLHSPELAPAPE